MKKAGFPQRFAPCPAASAIKQWRMGKKKDILARYWFRTVSQRNPFFCFFI
jgi:hypothetical protein